MLSWKHINTYMYTWDFSFLFLFFFKFTINILFSAPRFNSVLLILNKKQIWKNNERKRKWEDVKAYTGRWTQSIAASRHKRVRESSMNNPLSLHLFLFSLFLIFRIFLNTCRQSLPASSFTSGHSKTEIWRKKFKKIIIKILKSGN